MKLIGSNRNTNDIVRHTSYTLNDVTATEIAVANPERLNFEVFLAPGTNDVNAIIRLYDALIDNLKVGMVLTRHAMGNDIFFSSSWKMTPDNTYIGPISAIAEVGNIDIHVIEY